MKTQRLDSVFETLRHPMDLSNTLDKGQNDLGLCGYLDDGLGQGSFRGDAAVLRNLKTIRQTRIQLDGFALRHMPFP